MGRSTRKRPSGGSLPLPVVPAPSAAPPPTPNRAVASTSSSASTTTILATIEPPSPRTRSAATCTRTHHITRTREARIDSDRNRHARLRSPLSADGEESPSPLWLLTGAIRYHRHPRHVGQTPHIVHPIGLARERCRRAGHTTTPWVGCRARWAIGDTRGAARADAEAAWRLPPHRGCFVATLTDLRRVHLQIVLQLCIRQAAPAARQQNRTWPCCRVRACPLRRGCRIGYRRGCRGRRN